MSTLPDQGPPGKMQILSVPQVAQFLRVHHSTIYRMLAKGEIPAFKIGSDWRFERNAIEQWVKDKMGVNANGRGNPGNND